MRNTRESIRNWVKSALKNTWMLVAVVLTYNAYTVFSITNGLIQIVVGAFICTIVLFAYAILMVIFDI